MVSAYDYWQHIYEQRMGGECSDLGLACRS